MRSNSPVTGKQSVNLGMLVKHEVDFEENIFEKDEIKRGLT